MQDMLKFITCGSVDDGKSTLIGRLLYDSKVIFRDQIEKIKKDSKKYGSRGKDMDFALLVDGLKSEREQGITIDVAYRYFSTKKRKFIIADTPGHEQYTKNMVTGASRVDLALILIDARKGVLEQTKRHSYIVSLLGIRNVIIVINKMDLVGYSNSVYEKIKKEYEKIISGLLNHKNMNFLYIPVSALYGDNIINSSSKMPWYRNKTLIQTLENIKIIQTESENCEFRFVVQYINRANSDFRGFSGTIIGGSVKVGDIIEIFPSKKKTKIKSIILPSIGRLKQTNEAYMPMAVTITLEDEIDISRGDIFVKPIHNIFLCDRFETIVIWMSESPMRLNESYIVKRMDNESNGIFSIDYKVNISSFTKENVNTAALNDIVKCTLSMDRKIAVDSYQNNKNTGSFIIIDRYTNDTVGAGIIIDAIYNDFSDGRQTKQNSLEKELNCLIRKYYPDWECKKL